jgi:HEAT repeat protein
LLADDDVRRFALNALGAIGKAPPAVAGFLHSKSELDGVAAAVCLGSAGGPDAIDALVAALSTTTPFLVRVAAEGQLARLGDAAVPALSKASTDAATVREKRSAVRALGATKSASAVPAVQAALGGNGAWIRFSARLAAAQLIKELPRDATVGLAAVLEWSKTMEPDATTQRLK